MRSIALTTEKNKKRKENKLNTRVNSILKFILNPVKSIYKILIFPDMNSPDMTGLDLFLLDLTCPDMR